MLLTPKVRIWEIIKLPSYSRFHLLCHQDRPTVDPFQVIPCEDGPRALKSSLRVTKLWCSFIHSKTVTPTTNSCWVRPKSWQSTFPSQLPAHPTFSDAIPYPPNFGLAFILGRPCPSLIFTNALLFLIQFRLLSPASILQHFQVYLPFIPFLELLQLICGYRFTMRPTDFINHFYL